MSGARGVLMVPGGARWGAPWWATTGKGRRRGEVAPRLPHSRSGFHGRTSHASPRHSWQVAERTRPRRCIDRKHCYGAGGNTVLVRLRLPEPYPCATSRRIPEDSSVAPVALRIACPSSPRTPDAAREAPEGDGCARGKFEGYRLAAHVEGGRCACTPAAATTGRRSCADRGRRGRARAAQRLRTASWCGCGRRPPRLRRTAPGHARGRNAPRLLYHVFDVLHAGARDAPRGAGRAQADARRADRPRRRPAAVRGTTWGAGRSCTRGRTRWIEGSSASACAAAIGRACARVRG